LVIFRQLDETKGEVIVDTIWQVEDTKGNNGEDGSLIVTNLRVIWTADKNPRTNLSVLIFYKTTTTTTTTTITATTTTTTTIITITTTTTTTTTKTITITTTTKTTTTISFFRYWIQLRVYNICSSGPVPSQRQHCCPLHNDQI